MYYSSQYSREILGIYIKMVHFEVKKKYTFLPQNMYEKYASL